MFGFGKKSKESNEARFSREFDDLVRQVKSVDREKQGLVGRGIQEAEKSFFEEIYYRILSSIFVRRADEASRFH
jgi:hypothetical protein